MTCGLNAIVSGGVPVFAVLSRVYGGEMPSPHACAIAPFGRTVGFKFRSVLRRES
jgi:hypothetical protein